MPFFNQNIFELTEQNTDFRREILTGQHSQLVLMSIEPGDDIGEETHDVDQILVVVSGEGEAVLDGERSQISAQRAIVVPAGTQHNFINTGQRALKLWTVYSPPEEAPGTLHRTRAEAQAAEGH